ncbi:hybrid PKS-NRPS [Xylaria flabelliformis]|nr:hybrid PKS-NRPS [Xylaria flabelliformis]
MYRQTINIEPIALVGRSLRFPGANSISEFIDILQRPGDILGDFPPDRLNIDGCYHPDGDKHGTTNVRKSYFITQDHRAFDAAFFNISPVEAEAMDPQQRILLELVHEAMESAGLILDKLQGSRTSVFVGLMSSDFSAIQQQDRDTVSKYAVTGAASSIMSNRISYFFDWKGPSMTIDTACSSSLVAVHHAVQSLRSGESDLAVVAGANLILSPEPYITESKLHMLSPDSRCRMWDARADGYARGDGFAVVILKKLSNAVQDKDNIISIIRETAVNTDGRTAGLTTPSPSAQAALIRETYERAGLDCRSPTDRCQYFEAHGTGTPTGDPVEAQAVQSAFFPQSTAGTSDDEQSGHLLIGSVKTVLGHLEGCAGLAGLLKASLAAEKGIIFPNLHFDVLSPAVEPFYRNMKIPTLVLPWPDVPSESPRRVSINSFGFGGANAHAIIESYAQSPVDIPRDKNPGQYEERSNIISGGPFLFSANSQYSLLATVERMINFLRANKNFDLRSLAWTLQSRRTTLPARAAVSGINRDRLLEALEGYISNAKSSSAIAESQLHPLATDRQPRILGIFTGQGAQWPKMGRELLLTSKLFAQVIDRLQKSLNALADPPSWSLKSEVMADEDSSRVSEAQVGQPLCTAIQIALIDVLRSAGVSFGSVIGHSSGEIAAAYAAGFLSASDAIRVSYYRGYHAALACGPEGQTGAMMIADMTFHDGLELCQSGQFAGRLTVAASNSSKSITLSGDGDAINEALDLLKDSHSARLLRVDKAYHSHHMNPVAEPYIRSLRSCNIQLLPGESQCTWISSVTLDEITTKSNLGDFYWAENMIKPVLFAQAVERAVRDAGSVELMIEVGPHATLRVPATQSANEIGGTPIPYCSLLKRGGHDVESFSSALGYIWTALGNQAGIDFHEYWNNFEDIDRVYVKGILEELPTYPWDHRQLYWRESRISRNMRLRSDAMHPLLGSRRPDDSAYEMRWRNIVHLGELPWLQGHTFQGQVIFPAAGYVSMALEAAKALMAGRLDQAIKAEIQDMIISRALILSTDLMGTELTFSLKRLEEKDEEIIAEFVCSSCPGKADSELQVNATGRIRVILTHDKFPMAVPNTLVSRATLDIDIQRFYDTLLKVGFDYSGLFRGLKEIRRTTRRAIASASWQASELDTSLLVHPAVLDTGFQAIFASVSSISTIHTPYLPTRISRIRISASLDEMQPMTSMDIMVNSYVTDMTPPTKGAPSMIRADLDISHGDRWTLQVEGLSLTPLSDQSPSNDRQLFWKTVWEPDVSSGITASKMGQKSTLDDSNLPELLERLSHLCFRELYARFPREKVTTFKWYHQRAFEYMEDTFSRIDAGQHSVIKKEWANDTREELDKELAKFPETIDLQVANMVTQNFPAVLAGETTMIEVLTRNDMLTRLYKEGLVLSRGYDIISRMALQICHRHPSVNILEVGAGTGSTTEHILESTRGAFSSYVYTDISSGFFGKARERFQDHLAKMEYKTLDIGLNPAEQGFMTQAYDVVVASSVLHATPCLRDTLKNVRSLLKPGGYLLLLEPTGSSLRVSYILSGLPGWWLGGNDGRRLFPGLSPDQWNVLLRETGFTGVDTLIHDSDDTSKHVYAAMMSQAADYRVTMLRQPLLSLENMPEVQQLWIVGGSTPQTEGLVEAICQLLQPWEQRCIKVKKFDEIDVTQVITGATLLCLSELDNPVFESITENTFSNMQKMLVNIKNVLWITTCRIKDPYANMIVGVARVILNEETHLNFQVIDFNNKNSTIPCPKYLTEALLRLLMRDTLGDDVLWSTEPELAVENGKLLIPRLFPDQVLNDRFNSNWRSIQAEISSDSHRAEVHYVNGCYCLRQAPSLEVTKTSNGHTVVRARLTSLHPIEITPGMYVYVCLGSVVGSGQAVIALALENASVIQTRQDWTLKCDQTWSDEEGFFQSFIENIVAHNILCGLTKGSVLLLNQPERSLADTVSRLATDIGVKVVLASTDPPAKDSGWIHTCFFASQRHIRSLLPIGINRLVDFDTMPHNSTLHTIRSCMSPFSSELNVSTIFPDRVRVNDSYAADSRPIKDILQMAIRDLKARDIVESPRKISFIDWKDQDTYIVDVRPYDPQKLLRGDKTYFLAGLTGDLGQSLSRWMVANGARYLVLASRSANVSSLWLEEMRDTGAEIRAVSVDITDREALSKACSEMRMTMPEVGGVVNGAMVLSDMIFYDMTFEAFTKVLKPKVDGSKNLDELFRDSCLDFFIMLTSLSAVAGFRGQANYAAANMFMTGLAEKRRHEGLHTSEIITGLQSVKSTMVDIPPWFYNPRFGHCTLEGASSEERAEMTAATPIRQRLEDTTTVEEATCVLQEDFTRKLALLLQIGESNVNERVPLIDLGVDSLVAIEIRSWFIKELSVDIPALKTLSGCTVAELCEDVAGKFFGQKETQGNVETSVTKASSDGRSSISSDTEDLIHEKVEIVNAKLGDGRMISLQPTGATAPSHLVRSFGLSKLGDYSGAAAPAKAALGQRRLVRAEPMSYAQSRLWFLTTYAEDSTYYNVVLSYDIRGPLNISRFKNAFKAIISRHRMFRTCFFGHPETGKGMQGILDSSPVTLEQRRVTSDAQIREDIDRVQRHVFDLESGSLFLATLLHRTHSLSTFVIGYSHIIMDGSSLFTFLKDLNEAYQGQYLAPTAHEYVDFTSTQRLLVDHGGLEKEINFWKAELSPIPDALPLLDVSHSRSRSDRTAYGTHTVRATVPFHHTLMLKKLSQKLSVTPFHFHLAAIQWLLFKFLPKTDDICIGIADANRLDQRYIETIGIFLNLLPLRFRRQFQETFEDAVINTSQKALAALDHSRLPFEVILEELDVERSLASMPLFQVFVNYRMGAFQQNPLGECELWHRSISEAVFAYDLFITVTEPTKDSCVVEFTVRDDIYTEGACGLLVKTFVHLLGQLCEDPCQRLDQYSLFSAADARLGIEVGQVAKRESRLKQSLSNRVDTLSQSMPNDTAVKDGYGNILTYRQLAAESIEVSAVLSTAGINKGSYVGVVMHPCSFTISSLLAILRLGAIYVPLDLHNPPDRLRQITEDCHPVAIICQQNTLHLAEMLCTENTKVIDLTFLPGSNDTHQEDCSHMDLPAFALYTSGSSGKPKGVLLSQSNFLHSVDGTFDGNHVDQRDIVLQQSSLGFDLSLHQICRAICSAGTLIIVPQVLRRNPEEISKMMLAENVTLTVATPSEYTLWLSYGSQYLKNCSAWKSAAFSGENISSQMAQLFHRLDSPHLDIFNWFGPTEAGVFSIDRIASRDMRNFMADQYPCIGRPIPNVSVYILDEQLHLVPTGFAGEICVGGPTVALGYISEELTKSKFVLVNIGSVQERLYRSGDKGRILSDGTIRFLGRLDTDLTVKLRGFRIDLNDIAGTVIRAAGGTISDAAVSIRGDPEFLIAFVVFAQNHTPVDSTKFLRELCSNLPLPDYMRPSTIFSVSKLPLNPNGKRDFAALKSIPLPQSVDVEQDTTPLDGLETQLRDLWIETLPEAASSLRLGRDTKFFQVGGSSVLLMKLRVLIDESFGVQLSLASLIQFNTLQQMAAVISERRRHKDIDASFVSSLSDVGIDWEAETKVHEDLLLRADNQEPPQQLPQSGGRRILLTGSTEILGRSILERLVEDSDVAKIHCVAVPVFGALDSYSKVESYVGNLFRPNMSLGQKEMAMLSQDVDLIIHASVEGSFLNSYENVRDASLGAVKHLTRIARKRRIPIHCISSSRVILFSGAASLREVSVSRFPPPPDGSEGLTAARWACERYLENIASELRLPVYIHRCCAFTSDKAPEADVLNSIWRYSRRMKAAPILETVGGFIDCVPLETLVQKFMSSLMNNHSNPQQSPIFIHHTSGNRITARRLAEYFEDEDSGPVENLPLAEWIRWAQEMGLSDFAAAFLDAVGKRDERVFFPLLLKTQ